MPVSPRPRRTAIDPAQPDVAARTRRPEVYDAAADMPASGPIPRTPRPLRITLGVLFLLLSAWLGLLFLPGHRPLSVAEEAELAQRAGQGEVLRQRETRLGEGVHLGGNVGAGALALAGIGFALSGALYRAAAQVRCRRCQRTVVAWKGAFGLSCPLGEHYARVQWLMVGLTALFWIGVLVVAAFIGLWIL